MKKIHKLIFMVLAVILVVAVIFALPNGLPGGVSSALALTLNKPFGGQVILRTSCAGGWGIIVGPPTAGAFVFINNVSKLYEYKNAFFGNWVLGVAGLVTVPCLVGGSIFGVPIGTPVPNPLMPAGFPIIHIGTSKTP